MNEVHLEYYKTPVGELVLGSFHNKLCLCDWRYRKMRNSIDSRIKKELNADFIEKSTEVGCKTKDQLNKYFDRKLEQFDIPLLLVGTDFQKSVWETLLQVSYGETDTYSGLSKKLNNEKAIRAVASANGANAISIIVPCHRIIGIDGSLVGYAGGLDAKRKLLQLENAIIKHQYKLF